jgi:F-type H+-transporting ATPase subunit b
VPQLDPTWFASQLFWLFICFTILYVLLSKLILPPLQGVIATRKGTIESDLNAAQEFKTNAAQAKASYEETLVKSREAARVIMAEAEAANKVRAEEAIKALDAQSAVQSAKAVAAISAKKQEIMNALMPSTLEFASMIVEKLTQHSPNPEQLQKAFSAAQSTEGKANV